MDTLKVVHSQELENDTEHLRAAMALLAESTRDLLRLEIGQLTQEEYDAKWPKYEPIEDDEIYYCSCPHCEGHDD